MRLLQQVIKNNNKISNLQKQLIILEKENVQRQRREQGREWLSREYEEKQEEEERRRRQDEYEEDIRLKMKARNKEKEKKRIEKMRIKKERKAEKEWR